MFLIEKLNSIKFIMGNNSDKIPMRRYVYGICYDGEIVYTGRTKDMTFRWQAYKDNHTMPESRIQRQQVRGEKGVHTPSPQIIETVHDITRRGIEQVEGSWQQTCEELGFNLLNKYKEGNGNKNDLNSITYANHQARQNERIPCEFCGAMSTHGHIARHQRTQKCLNNRMVLFS